MRTYTAEQRAEAVALAASVGPVRAAAQLGYPRRTVAKWMHRPESSVVIRQAEATIADRLAAAHEVALAAVLEGLRDPKAKLGDRAAALRVLGEQRLLAEGRATANLAVQTSGVDLMASLSDEDRADLATALDAELDRRRAGDAIAALPDPTIPLDRDTIRSLIAAIERRLGDGQ